MFHESLDPNIVIKSRQPPATEVLAVSPNAETLNRQDSTLTAGLNHPASSNEFPCLLLHDTDIFGFLDSQESFPHENEAVGMGELFNGQNATYNSSMYDMSRL